MRVFMISGKFQKNGKWSNREADFIGHFIKHEQSDIIEGYTEEQYITPYEPIRYIKGLYIERQQQIAFLKICNSTLSGPVAYAFPNLNEQGFRYCFDVAIGIGFFPENNSKGRAIVRLEEVLDEKEKHKLSKKILTTFNEKSHETTSKMKLDLLQNVEEVLKKLLEREFQ